MTPSSPIERKVIVMFAPHKQRSKGIILTAIAFLSGIAMFLTGCSSNDSGESAGNGAKVAAQQANVKVSSNLPDSNTCPANFTELYNTYGIDEVDNPRTIVESDIVQSYVDYADGVGCSVLGDPETQAIAEAAVSAICGGASNTDVAQAGAVMQLEAMNRFLYGKGFGAIECSRLPGTVTVDSDMLNLSGRYNPQ